VNVLRPIALITLAAMLAACSSADSDWKKADSQNTVAAYQDFLKQHPNDAHASQATQRIQSLQDDQTWADAQKANTTDSLQQYLQKYPSGTHATDAKTLIAGLDRAAAWKVAQTANTEPALQDFIQKYNQGPEVDLAKAQLEKLRGYRVELATSHSQKEADKTLASLKSRHAAEIHDLVVVPPSGSEKLYRIASGPMTEENAKSTCEKLKKAHQHCEAVKAS
jgi:LPS O-antigen subunit length determinant protein (WzzB/FepE family)